MRLVRPCLPKAQRAAPPASRPGHWSPASSGAQKRAAWPLPRLPVRKLAAWAALSLVALTIPVPAGAQAPPRASPTGQRAPLYCGIPDHPVRAAFPPPVHAEAYEVMDARTGAVLGVWHPDLRIAPASLAKLATFDLALRALRRHDASLATPVPIGTAVRTLAREPGITLMGLNRAGPTVSLNNLLLGMILPSGNDAAVAVANYLAGSVAAFAHEMNALAVRLHMPATHFDNPDGLPGRHQVTTAAGMALLARHIWTTYPDFARFTARRSFEWLGTTIPNIDPLLGCDPRVVGMKGGWLPSSGFQLVTVAEQGTRAVIVVVLGSATLQASDHAAERLVDWALARTT